MSEWPAVAFDDVMATTRFDVHERAAHRRQRRRLPGLLDA